MGIVDEDIVRVRETTDIVALISQYVALRKVGQRWSGLCPFHNEKSPSFSVDATSGLYHCFGCKASGDAITFVREMEQTDFVGAIELLAARAGYTLRYTDQYEGESRKRVARLHDELERAAEWYHERLRTSPDAAAARSYLRGRGFSVEEVTHFRIGWAPDAWDQLVRALKIGEKDAVGSGLGFVNRAGRLQDFFRARILFPIMDDRSRDIGFGGRKLPDAEGAKYQNSRDNDVYHKSRALYGLNWAKAQAVQNNEMVVCEGYTDVIGFNRAGIERAVATCGTALTEDHVKLIRRFADRLVLAYDADEAGQSAADRVYGWEKTHDIEVAVVELPDGTDPDELASTDPNALREAVAHARPFLQFRVDRVLSKANLITAEGRSKAAEQALVVVAEHPDAFVRDQYVMQVADVCRVDIDLVRQKLREMADPRRRAAAARSSTRAGSGGSDSSRSARGSRSAGAAGSYDDGDPGPTEPGLVDDPDGGGHSFGRGGRAVSGQRNEPFAGAHGPGGARNPGPSGGTRGVRARGADTRNAVELEALNLLIARPEEISPFLSSDLFTDPLIREAYDLVSASPDLATARDQASSEIASLLARLAVEPTEAAWLDVVVRLATELGRVVMADLEAQARSSSDPLSFVESMTWLKLNLDALRASKVEVEKLEDLLDWLGDRRRESDRG
ncbi:MAG: DNA primase [Microthrixaceae bacterium]